MSAGKGSWSQWLYEVELKDTRPDGSFGLNIQTAETDKLNHTVDGLVPNTTYYVRVRAKSEAGVGPWSSFFIGTTLQQGIYSLCLTCPFVGWYLGEICQPGIEFQGIKITGEIC